MLVSCPGCGKKVSDRAPRCPFCQGPLAATAAPGPGPEAASVLHRAVPASIAVSPQPSGASANPAASGLPPPAPSPPAAAPASEAPPPRSAAPAPALPGRYERGDSIGDAFRVRDVLGEGGFGIVYLVHPKGSAALLALKTIRDEWLRDEATRELFRKEAQLWIALGRHPYLVRAHYVHEDHGRLFIAMEYVAPDGRGINSIQGYLDRDPPDLRRALRWAIETCHGLEHAYARGIRCHRDIKPQNILVGADGAVRVTDFGIVGIVAPGGDAAAFPASQIEGAGQTVAGAVFGTPTHMPPEQFSDAASCDERSDVYSLGVVLYQMASRGALPFLPEVPGPDAGRRLFFALRRMHEQADPPPLASPLWPIVARCLRKERGERYPGFAALRGDLETLLRERTGETVTVPASETAEAMELCQQGMSFASLGQEEEALACYDRALALAPNEAALHNNRGNSLSRTGRVGEALAAFARALELRPRYDTALVNHALALARAARAAEGLPDCERALAINARSAEAWVTRGVILAGLGRRPEALEAYDRALEIDDRDPVAWGNKAGNLLELGRFDEALAGYDRALSIDPRSAERWIGKGTTLGEMARHEEAVACYDEGLRLDRANPRGWYNKGNSLVQLQRYEEALACFRETNQLAPLAGIARYNRGLCELTLERPQEAAISFRRYLEMCPGDELAGQARWLLQGIETGELTKLQRGERGPQAGRLRSDTEMTEPAPVASPTPLLAEAVPIGAVPAAPSPAAPAPAPAAAPAPLAAPPAPSAAPSSAAPAIPPPRPLPVLGLSAERLNNEAKAHFQGGRFTECAEASRRALELEPWNAVAWGTLANARFKLGQVEDSLRAFDQALGGEGIQVDHWVSKAAVEQMSGRESEALRSCLEFLALVGPKQQGFVSAIQKQAGALQRAGVPPAPRSAFGFAHEGAFQGAAGRMREAVASFDRALALDPRLAACWVFKAEALVQMREPDAAARELEDEPLVREAHPGLLPPAPGLSRLDARHVAALTNKAVLLDHQGSDVARELALGLLTKAALAAGDGLAGSLAWTNLALAQAARGVHALAVEAFDKAIELDPRNAEALEARADSLARQDRPAEALASAEACLRKDPARLSRPEEALARFDRALAIDPSYLGAQYHKGLLLRRQKRYPEAVATLDQALALAPKNALVLSARAECLEEAGRPFEAAQAWQRWLALVPGTDAKVPEIRAKLQALAHQRPTDVPAAPAAGPAEALAVAGVPPIEALKKGLFCQNQGQHERALPWFDACLSGDPDNVTALAAKGESLSLLMRHAEALPCFDGALQRNPAHAPTWLKKGACLDSMRRFDEALAAFDRAIEHDAKSALAWHSRGLALGNLGRVEEAVAAFEGALAVDPRSPLPRLNLAELLDRLGRHQEAAKAYQQFLGVASPVLLAAQAQRARARLHEIRGGGR